MTGRNDACPCGSGRKFKTCCIGKKTASRGFVILLITLLTIGAAGVAAAIASKDDPGAAPAGKVWSPEHGHWHDA